MFGNVATGNTRSFELFADHPLDMDTIRSIVAKSRLVSFNGNNFDIPLLSLALRLMRAFPQGRSLDSDPDTIRRWNAGQIAILFAHPASAGHGLNLQDGGNILVYFGHWWNLEERMQILERIGPTRQMQAGHDRAVFVHNIIAKDTVDELVIERVQSKRAVQDILLDAMKRKTL